jgi:quinol monooxygenase YgiN
MLAPDPTDTILQWDKILCEDNTNMTLHVVAHLPAKPDKVDELKTLLTSLLEPTRKEQGCIRYVLYQNTKEPTDFTFIEEWEGQEDLDRHLSNDHMKVAFGRFPELLSTEANVQTYHLVG